MAIVVYRHRVFLVDPRPSSSPTRAIALVHPETASLPRSPGSCGQSHASERRMMVPERLHRHRASLVPLRAPAARTVTDEEITFMLHEGVATGHIPKPRPRSSRLGHCRLGERRARRVMTPRNPDRMASTLDDPEAESGARFRGERPLALSGRGGRLQQRDRRCSPRICSSVRLAGQPFDLRAANPAAALSAQPLTGAPRPRTFKTSGEPMGPDRRRIRPISRSG